MRVADALRRQSASTISSIRLSLVGAQVGWIMNTSLPRTLSSISTLTSPSLKRPTSALPRSILKRSTTRFAKARWALPVKIFSSATLISRSRLDVEYGWGGRTRTCACKDQNLVPYRLGDTPIFTLIKAPECVQNYCCHRQD